MQHYNLSQLLPNQTCSQFVLLCLQLLNTWAAAAALLL
jgi:hypothetical protein